MGCEFVTYLVDPIWFQELVAAWKARDAGLPIPPVRWPCEDKTREYLSHIWYDWPNFYEHVGDADLPDGSYWYGDINELVAAINQARTRTDLALEPQTRTAVDALLRFAEPFMFYNRRHDDYGSKLCHILSPSTCAALAPLHARVDFRAAEPIVKRCVQENAEQAPKKEYRESPWYFAERDPNELLRIFCIRCFQCCQESCRRGWALGLAVA